MRKAFFFFTFIFLGSFVLATSTASDALAQGTYSCIYDPAAGGLCQVDSASCASGYVPNPGVCALNNGKGPECAGLRNIPCVASAALPTPTTAGGGGGGGGGGGAPVAAGEPVRGGAGCSDKDINTAIGCVPVLDSNNTNFMKFIVTWGGGIAGFVAFLLFSYGSFLVMTSSGTPQRVQAGKELITSALMGLILLVSSAFLLRFIGIDLLGLFD